MLVRVTVRNGRVKETCVSEDGAFVRMRTVGPLLVPALLEKRKVVRLPGYRVVYERAVDPPAFPPPPEIPLFKPAPEDGAH